MGHRDRPVASAAQKIDVHVPAGARGLAKAAVADPLGSLATPVAQSVALLVPYLSANGGFDTIRASFCRIAEGKRMFVRRRSGVVTFARCNAIRLRVSLLASVFAMGVLAPSKSEAACTDTFSDFLVTAGTPPGFTGGFSYQSMFPLGIGASINAAVATMNTVNTAFLSPSSSFVSARGDPQPGQMGGGVWARATAGSSDTRASTTGTIQGVGGTGTCDGSLTERYYGYQFGFDLAKLNFSGGANLHVGLTAGYFATRARDTTGELAWSKTLPSGTFDFYSPPGSFEAETQVPFLGLYAAFAKGNFFADFQVRHDLYLMRFDDPMNGLSDQPHNAYGITAGVNAGFRFPFPGNWFVEPSAGALWSRVKMGSIDTTGSGLLDLPPLGTVNFHNDGSVRVDDIESILGRVSVRIGTTVAVGDVALQPFVTGSLFHEFAGDVTATALRTEGGVLTTSTSRFGTYGQVGVGAATVFGDSGWLGFFRADYKTGENVEGYGVNGGIRYHW